jgi:hypothetical protein
VPGKSKQRVQRGIVGSTREEILAAIRGACDAASGRPASSSGKRRPSKSRKTKPQQVMP